MSAAQNIKGNATHLIAVMGALGSNERGVTMDELVGRLPLPRPDISNAAGRLVTRGLVERLEAGVYRLTLPGRELLQKGGKISSGVARGWRKMPVYSDSLRQRAWKAMRLNQRFAVADLVTLAARADETEAHETIRRYCHQLVKAGYLVELPARVPGEAAGSNGFKVFRMVRDTGDAAPQYQAAQRQMYDRNTREVFPCA